MLNELVITGLALVYAIAAVTGLEEARQVRIVALVSIACLMGGTVLDQRESVDALTVALAAMIGWSSRGLLEALLRRPPPKDPPESPNPYRTVPPRRSVTRP